MTSCSSLHRTGLRMPHWDGPTTRSFRRQKVQRASRALIQCKAYQNPVFLGGFFPDEVPVVTALLSGLVEDLPVQPVYITSSMRDQTLHRLVEGAEDQMDVHHSQERGIGVNAVEAEAPGTDLVHQLGRFALFVGEAKHAACLFNDALLDHGLDPALVAGDQPDHWDMALSRVVSSVRTAHAKYFNLLEPLKVLEQERVPNTAQLVMNLVTDQGEVPTITGELRMDSSHVVVIDGLCSEEERGEILSWLTSPNHNHLGPPPEDKWAVACVDRDGDEAVWGLNKHVLEALKASPPRALMAIQSRLQLLYPEWTICYMPAHAMAPGDSDPEEGGLSAFVGNAVMPGDPCHWHLDADPFDLAPDCPWVQHYGYYRNREPGKPLFVSMLIYLNEEWPEDYDAETLVLDPASQTGVFVRPKPGRVLLMDQDLPHRISAPSAAAARPRYSLVWKLIFVPDRGRAPCNLGLSRPEWGPATRFGSSADVKALGTVQT